MLGAIDCGLRAIGVRCRGGSCVFTISILLILSENEKFMPLNFFFD